MAAPPGGPLRGHGLIVALSLLLLLQVALLSNRWTSGAPAAPHWLEVGDTIDDVRFHDRAGPTTRLRGKHTLLLVFDSHCAHCRTVAPTWSAWLESEHDDLNVVAVSAEPRDSAAAFADEYDWAVAVWTVDARERSSPAAALTSRTPWLFLVDEEGVILAEGNGADIEALVGHASVQPLGRGRTDQ